MDKNNMLCSRCKKRLAVIYMTRMENGQTISEGLCLRRRPQIQTVDMP